VRTRSSVVMNVRGNGVVELPMIGGPGRVDPADQLVLVPAAGRSWRDLP